MVKYSCEKCGKEFTQKGHYTKHTTKKNPCVFESKIEEIIEKVVAEKMIKINYDYKNRKRRQDSEKQYVENGSIYVFKKNGFIINNNRLFVIASCKRMLLRKALP